MSNNIDSEGHQHIDTNRARAGSAPGVMRYVLMISLGLAVVAMAAIAYFA